MATTRKSRKKPVKTTKKATPKTDQTPPPEETVEKVVEQTDDVVIIEDEVKTDQTPPPEETVEKTVDQDDVQEQPPEEPPEEPAVKHHSENIPVQFLEVWIETFKQGDDNRKIAALVNFVNAVIKEDDGRHMNKLIREIKENQLYFNKKFIFAGINSLPMSKRIVVESVITALTMIADGSASEKSISIDTLREYTKSEEFANWVAGKISA